MVQMSWTPINTRGLPERPPIISHQATITDDAGGLCYVPVVSGDTVPSGTAIAAGYYDVDVWAEDVDGNRLPLAFGQMFISPAVTLPGTLVTPLPEQEPLAQGPAGPPGADGPAGPTGPTGASGIPIVAYATLGDFPDSEANVGAFGYALNTNLLYVSENGGWRSVSGVANSVTGTASQGTFTIQAGQFSSDATDNAWIGYQPSEVGSVPWVHWMGTFNNATWARKNNVSRFGWNVGPGGGLITTGTNIGGWSSEYETSYEGAPYTKQSERHEVFWHPDGSSTRIWSCLSSLIAPYVSTLFINAETVDVGPTGGGIVSIGPTTAGMNSPSTLNSVYVDDSQGWLKAANGNAAVTVLLSGEVDVSATSNVVINANGTGFLKNSSTTIFEWGSGFMAGFYDFLQIGADATSGAHTKNSPLIRWRGNYWNGATSVRYDADIQHIVDSTGPAGHFSFQFNESPVASLSNDGVFAATEVQVTSRYYASSGIFQGDSSNGLARLEVSSQSTGFTVRLSGSGSQQFKVGLDGQIILQPSSGAVSSSGEGWIRFNGTHFEASVNGGAWTQFGP